MSFNFIIPGRGNTAYVATNLRKKLEDLSVLWDCHE
jgi:hypothetical protein